MANEFMNNITVSLVVVTHPFSLNMALNNAATENNSSYNDQHGVQIKVNSEEDLWKESNTFARTLIPAMIFVGILMLAGCVGNSLVVYIFGFKFKTATQHSLIVCLACFDLLMSTIAMPSEIADMRFHHTFSSAFACKLLRSITMFSAVSSSLILVIITVDRHRRVTKPLTRQMTVRHARCWEVVSVCVSLFFSWPSFVMSGLRSTDTRVPGLIGKDCSVSNQFKDTKLPFAHNAVLGIGFVVVITVLAVLYFQIWKTAKNHMSHIFSRPKATLSSTFRRPKATLSSTFSDAFKHNGQASNNSSPNVSNETAVSGCVNPEKKTGIYDLKDISSSPTSSQRMDTSSAFSEVHTYDTPETKVVKECDEQLWKEELEEIEGVMSRNFDLECRVDHNKNVFNPDTRSLAETADLGYASFKLRSWREISSDEILIHSSRTCKLCPVLSNPETRFSNLLNGDLLLKSASLQRRQKGTSENSGKHTKSLTPKTIQQALNSLSDFEQPQTKAHCLTESIETIGTSSVSQGEGLLMHSYAHEMSPNNKQIIIAEDVLNPGTKCPDYNVESDMENNDVGSCCQMKHTDIFNHTFTSVTCPAQCKKGNGCCANLMVSDAKVSLEDMSSISTNSTSLESVDVSRFSETVGNTNSQDCSLKHRCAITQSQFHALDNCCCKSDTSKVGQADVAPLDDPCVGDTTRQLFHGQVLRLSLMDMIPASQISQLVGQRCQPMATISDAMLEERVSAEEQSDKVDCELCLNKTLRIEASGKVDCELCLKKTLQNEESGEVDCELYLNKALQIEESGKVDCELYVNKSLQNEDSDCELYINKPLHKKMIKPKKISLTFALPRVFNRYSKSNVHGSSSENSNLQTPPKAAVFSITNTQENLNQQHSDEEQQRRISTNATTESSKVIGRRTSRQNDKTTLVAFSISSVFVLSFLPYLALMFVRAFLSNFDYNLQGASLCVYNIFLRFYLLNSAANPLLYGLLNDRFRQECKAILFFFLPRK